MKFIGLENVSGKRISVSQVRGADGRPFAVDAGEVGYLTPSAAAHPAIQRFIGAGLQEHTKDTPSKPEKKVETAPPPPTPESTEEVEETEEEEEEGEDLRETYVSAPGVTESNVDMVLEMFPALEDLAGASKEDLIDCGVSKSFINRLKDWASEQ